MIQETEICFNRKADAIRVKRRLRDYTILCRYHAEGRGSHWLAILVPSKMTVQSVRELAIKLYSGKYGR